MNNLGKLNPACLIGYHGMQNAGDDAFFSIMIDWLENQIGVTRVEVFGEQAHFPETNGAVQIVGVPKAGKGGIAYRLTELSLLCRNRLTVHAAGSLFQRRDFVWLFLSTAIAKLYGWLTFRPKKIVAIGVSLGPFHSQWDRFWCGQAMKLYDQVVLRDDSDSQLSIKMPAKQLIHGDDLALALQGPIKNVTSPLNAANLKKVGFTIVDRDRAHKRPEVDDQKREIMTEFLNQLHSRNELEDVTGMVFCNHPLHGDEQHTVDVLKTISNLGINATKCEYSSDIQKNFEAISELDLMVGNRMHSFIFALICRVPTVAIAYEPKITKFAKRCGLPDEIVVPLKELSVERLHAATEYALSQEARDKVDAALKRKQLEQQERLLEVARIINR